MINEKQVTATTLLGQGDVIRYHQCYFTKQNKGLRIVKYYPDRL